MVLSKTSRWSCIAVAVAGLAAGACNPGPAPDPRRPEADKAPPKVAVEDCKPVVPERQPPPVPYGQRSVTEGESLAREGTELLKKATARGVEPAKSEQYMTNAVSRFVTALSADPYNVDATYNLAAAYARIKRPQCSINLLSRLVPMRNHRSQQAKVNAKLDRLLGRNRHAGQLDPDFYELRSDARFRELVRKLDSDS